MSILKHKNDLGGWDIIGTPANPKVGNADPTSSFKADYIGLFYTNVTNGHSFVCTAINGNIYTWAALSTDISGKEDISNKLKSTDGGITSSATDTQYPSAKAVYEYHDTTKQNNLPAATSAGFLHSDTTGNLTWSEVDVSAAINTHNADSTAHSAIQTKIGTDISAHNLDSTSHNDIRTAVSGKLDKLPTVINDRYLHTNNSTGALEWVADNVFIATYGVTTYNEINDAVLNNKYIVCKNRYGINAEMYVLAYFDENGATFGSIGGSQLLGALCNARDIWSMYGGYVEMSDNKKDTIVGFEEATLYYPSTKAIAKYHDSTKQDSLPTVTNDRFLHTNSSTGKLEWSQVDMSSKENISNKVKSTTGLSGASTDDEYPSAKCVYNLIANVEDILASV